MYNKLFELSKLSNTQIKNRLEIDYTGVRALRNAKTINCDKFVCVGKKLGLKNDEMLSLVMSEIKLLLNNLK